MSTELSATVTESTVLADLPVTSSGARVWATLGSAGLLIRCYRGGDVRAGVDPERVAAVLTAVDARFSVAATLSVSLPLATTIPVLATGAAEVAQAAVERTLSGAATVALAVTDENAGTDLTALGTRIDLDAEGVEVSGSKRWIANALTAEEILVLARHRPGRHITDFTWVLVPSSAEGVTVHPADSTLFAASGSGHIDFDRVRVGRERILGRVGLGLPVFARHIATERLASALWGVQLCRRVIARTRDRLANRAHGDSTLWHQPAVRQRLATAIVRTQQLDALCRVHANAVARHHDAAAAATLKAAAGDTVGFVLGECAHLWGADGFAAGGLQELRAQAALFGIGGGATEVVLETVAEYADSALAELAGRSAP